MPSNWIESDVDVGGVRLHYLRTGKGEKPSLVLTHGFTDSGACWSPVARELESEYDVIMPDMRGHGLSARVSPDEDVDMPADLAGIIRGLGLEKPILCGHSMGAMTTFQAAARFHGLARAIVLEDPPWWLKPWPESQRAAQEKIFLDWAKSLPSQSLESLLEGYRRDHPSWPEETVRAMCESKKQLDPNIAKIMTAKMNTVDTHWTNLLSELRCPILVLTADPERGGIVTPETAAKISQLNSRVKVVKVEGVGHLIRYDAFGAFMAALKEFLKGC
jgi:N-formylmaleamate deformylase